MFRHGPPSAGEEESNRVKKSLTELESLLAQLSYCV